MFIPRFFLTSTGQSSAFAAAPLFVSAMALAFLQAKPALGEPELHASAHTMPGVVIPRGLNGPKLSAGADQSNFSLGTDQSKFNLGTSRNQSTARSSVGLKVDRENPAIMTIVGHNEADIEKLLAKRYHRVVIPVAPYSAPPGPMQQVLKQQQLTQQVVRQQTITQQTVVPQTPPQWNTLTALPIETVNRFMSIIAPKAKPPGGELSAEAKPLKAFGEATYIHWDPWYRRVQAVAGGRWQSYNNQLNTEVTAHITVYQGSRLAVSGVDVNLFKSAHPWDGAFNEAAKQAVLEVLNGLKGSSVIAFPAHTRRSEVSFDLVFATGGRPGVGISAPINDVETIYGL